MTNAPAPHTLLRRDALRVRRVRSPGAPAVGRRDRDHVARVVHAAVGDGVAILGGVPAGK